MYQDQSEAPTFIPGFRGVRVDQGLVFCVMCCRLCNVLQIVVCYFVLWTLYCTSFFDIRFLITPLISSNCS
jgi:hypothetical protein